MHGREVANFMQHGGPDSSPNVAPTYFGVCPGNSTTSFRRVCVRVLSGGALGVR